VLEQLLGDADAARVLKLIPPNREVPNERAA
jgi:hypothetical protein